MPANAFPPGVKSYRKGGKLYVYHRATTTRILAEPGTRAFELEVERLNKLAAVPKQPNAGTLGHLIHEYKKSPEFQGLAPRTRSDYQRIFNYLKDADDTMIVEITPGEVKRSRDKAFNAHKRHFANYMLAVLKLLFVWGVAADLCNGNPAASVKKIKRPRLAPMANRPWEEGECAAVLAASDGGIRVGIALGMFAGMRLGDALTVTRLAYDGHWIKWSQNKTGDLVELPAHPWLKDILNADIAARKVATEGALDLDPVLTLTATRAGKPYSLDGFRTIFFRLIKGLEKTGQVQPGLTFHGLRHTAGRKLAENGAEPHMIAAMLGHRTLAMAWHYSKDANRKELARAAVIKLSPRAKNAG
jgi:integrase